MDRQTQVAEIIKCGKDPKYFINQYCKISHPVKGLLPFKMYKFQEQCVDDFLSYKFNIVNKSRQLGLSTVTAAYAAWLILFNRDQNVLCLATKKTTAMNIIKKIKTIIVNLPPWLILPKKVGETKQSIEFDNRSQVQAIPTSEDAGRSEALSTLIVDECAHIRDFDKLWTGLSPTLSTGGRAILISTPLGVGNMFHALYRDAAAQRNNFNPISLPWTVHPEHDDEWYKEQCSLLGNDPRKIGQELHCEFATSGETFLRNEDIIWVSECIAPPVERAGFDKHIWIWKYPLTDGKYIISADVARGDSRDYSTFHVIDLMRGEVVAEYQGKIPPDRFAELLYEWGKKYNTALLAPENNSYGYTTLTKLFDLNYPKIYKQEHKGVYFGDYSPGAREDISKYGFHTGPKTRMQALGKLEEVIRNKYLKVYSSRFLDELKTFIWEGERPKAINKRSHDDLVMSLAIGSWVFDAAGGYNKHDQVAKDAILSGMGVSSKNISELSDNPGGTFSSWKSMHGQSPAAIGHAAFAGKLNPNLAKEIEWMFKI